MLDGSDVFRVAAINTAGELEFAVQSSDGEEISLDAYLAAKGAASMGDRIPVLAYGANMCPASIYSKFEKVARPDAHIVPTIYAELEGYDVVWSGGPGMNGNFIANLYTGEETEDTRISVGVNFLTREQLLVMHATEMNYDLASLDVDIDGVRVKALVYTGVDQILMQDGHPVAVKDITPIDGSRTLQDRTTRELVDWMIELPQIQAQLESEGAHNITSADEYVENTRELIAVKGRKMERKRAIHRTMAEYGQTAAYILPIPDSALMSWSNPSTIPTYSEQQQGITSKNLYVLPTSELPKDNWPNQKKRDLVLRSLGTHRLRMEEMRELLKRED